MAGESANYNLGITISAKTVNIDKELKKVENRFRRLSDTVEKSTKDIRSSLNLSEEAIEDYTEQYNKLNAKLNQIETAQDKASKKVKQSASTTKQSTKQMKKANKEISKNTKQKSKNTKANDNWLSSQSRSLAIATKSTVVWGAATTAIYGTQRALQEMHRTMMEVNSEMIALRRVMSEVTTDFKEMRNLAGDLGVEYASNIQDVISSMVEWGRQGRSQVEVLELTEAALLATNVAEMEAKESVEMLTASLLQFNMDASEGIEIVDRWNEVANNFAVNASAIATALRESGSAAQSAGISMDSLIGMVTSLSAATAKSGSRIGRSLRTVFSRIMGDAAQSGEALGKVETALSSVGIALRRDEGQYRDLSNVLTDLAVKWEDLDEVMQANIARAIGGRRRYSDVIALIENWDMALDATTSSMNSLNSAIEENEKYMQGMEANWKQVRAEFSNIINTFIDLGAKDISTGLAKDLRNLLQNFDDFIVGIETILSKMNKLEKVLLTSGAAFATFQGAVSLTSTTLLSASAGMTALLSSINPIIPIIGMVTAGVFNFIERQGRLNKIIEKGTNNYNELNKSLQRKNELTKTELENNREILNSYSKMAAEVVNFDEKREEMVNNMNESTIPGWDLFKTVAPGLEGTYEKIRNFEEERVQELTNAFPEIYEKYKDQVDSSNYENFLNSVIKRVSAYNDVLDESVASIDKHTNKMLENVKQGQRELKVIRAKENRYDNLVNTQNRTAKQEQELFELRQELLGQYPELASGSKTFAKSLDDVVKSKEEAFGDGGEQVEKVIKTMTSDISTLESSMKSLKQARTEVSKDIDKYSTKLENLGEINGENIETRQELTEALNKAKKRYETINERTARAQQLINKFSAEIKLLKEGMDSLSESEFSIIFEDALKILTELTDKMIEFKTSIKDVRGELEAGLAFKEFRAGLEGLTPTEEINAYLDEYESAQSKLMDIGRNVFDTDAQVDSQSLRNKLKDAVDEASEIPYEELGINVDDLFDRWDEEGYNAVSSRVKELISVMYKELDEEKENMKNQLEVADAVTNLINFDEDKIDEMTDKQLKKIMNSFEVASEKYDEGQFEMEFNIDETTDDIVKAEMETREFVDTMTELYNKITEISGVELDNLELEGTAAENAIKIRDAYSDLPDELSKLTKIDTSKPIDEQLKAVESGQQVIASVINKIKNADIAKSFSGEIETIVSRLKDLGVSLENTKNELTDMQIKTQLPDYREDIGLISEQEARVVKLNNKLTELRELRSKASSDTLRDKINRIVIAYENQRDVLEEINKLEEGKLDSAIKTISNFSIDNVSSIKEARKEIENITKAEERMNKVLSTMDLSLEQEKTLKNMLGVDQETVDKIIADLKKYIEDSNLRDIEISRQVAGYEEELGLISEQDKKVTELSKKIQTLNQLREEANDQDVIDRIGRVTQMYKDQREVLKDIEDIESNDVISGADESINNISIDDITSFEDAWKAIEKIRQSSQRVDEILNNMGYSTNQIKQIKSILGIDEETLNELIEKIKEKAKDTEQAWENALSNAFSAAVLESIDKFEKGMKDVKRVEIFGQTFFSSLFGNLDNDTIKKKMQEASDSISSALNLGETVSNSISEGVYNVAKSLSEGGSLGRALSTGIGAAIGVAFGMPKVGAQIGKFVGKIGEKIVGESTGVDKMKEAKKVNETLKETQKNLKEFGLQYDATFAKYEDEASGFESMFGKEEWDTDNLQAAKNDMKDMEKLLSNVSDTASQLNSDIKSAFGESLSYDEFRKSFDESIGKALEDSIMDSIWRTFAVEQYMNRLSGMMKKIFLAEGDQREKMIANFKGAIAETKNELSDMYVLYQDILGQIGIDTGEVSPDVTMDREFRAGSTSNITYNNTFAVNSQIFLGDEASARNAAKELSPYIEEYLEAQS